PWDGAEGSEGKGQRASGWGRGARCARAKGRGLRDGAEESEGKGQRASGWGRGERGQRAEGFGRGRGERWQRAEGFGMGPRRARAKGREPRDGAEEVRTIRRSELRRAGGSGSRGVLPANSPCRCPLRDAIRRWSAGGT